ncbi:cytochrome P450 [Amycolatopsis taiwanensis]|uniref:Cytochrome P450 n=1 Tax=Amycolatopsis taiwanensis TaxID=342230 RepID=A0A9W6R8S3_9PSEU|nr:cytochrome P450 [Amycolatopsis taiwanensis]GLY71266.1 cytochrome P450 [Amycolatopsis taiwanensis]
MTDLSAPEFPISRDNPFDPPAELGRRREEDPLSRMTYPDGHVGWLVTSYDTARAVLADARFSSRGELKRAPLAQGNTAEQTQPAPPGFFVSNDPPEHTRYRHLLTGQFTVRRMRELTSRIEEITAHQLDFLAERGPGADLVQYFGLPIPSLVICELLGVPYADREDFQRHSAELVRVGNSPEDRIAAYLGLRDYMQELVLDKRAAPKEDVLSGLTGSDLTDEELANIGFMLLGAGHDTTANMLALGTFALLHQPDQLDLLKTGSVGVAQVVEELLRYLSIVPFTVRTALTDIELNGHLVKAGESVTVSIQAANRDPRRFDRPDVLDLHRTATGQMAFGHGIHQCLGQQLARIEMQVAFPALFNRFPTLRLDIAFEDVPLRSDMLIYGVHRLPVTW